MTPAKVQKFVESLDPNRMYKVTGSKNYTHVLPANMSDADIHELMKREMTAGKHSLTEGSLPGNILLD